MREYQRFWVWGEGFGERCVGRCVCGEGCREVSSADVRGERGEVWSEGYGRLWVWGGGETKDHGAHLHGKVSSSDLAVIS